MMTFIAATKPVVPPDVAEPYLWALVGAGLVGVAAGFVAVWFVMRQTRRLSEQSAQSHLELAKREAAVASQELVSRAEEDIRSREAELNRDLDRRKIEIEMMLREIRSHEESLALLDGEEIRKQLREEVTFECQEELRALRTDLLEKSEQDVVQEGKRILVAT